jgi:simple sugar transport system permease protein
MTLDLIDLAASALRMSTPLLLAAMAGVVCERSGVVNIALEGLMLAGAFAAAAFTLAAGSPWLGLGGALAVGGLLGLLYGLFVIKLRADQIVTGTAFNMLAFGLTPLLAKALYGVAGSSPSIPLAERFHWEPLALACATVVALHFFLRMTPAGLWLRFAGQNPEALACAGVSPLRVRWAAVLTSGMLAAAGGAALSIYLSSSFARQMSAGRGFMALAALIFGRWQPVPAALACLLFGFTEALQIRLQGVRLPGMEAPVPVQFIQILPYLVTLLVLAGFVGRRGAPKALGRPYERA